MVPTACHGLTLNVTPNLRDGLRQIRYRDRSRFLWADAICINQSDIPERGRQVNIMMHIYRKSTNVLVWLGLGDDRAERAFSAVEEITDRCCSLAGIPLTHIRYEDSLYHLTNRWLPDLYCDSADTWEALSWLFSRPWFSRLWVLQEVNCGRNIEVLLGHYQTDWDSVALVASYIINFSVISGYWGFSAPECYLQNVGIMRRRNYHAQMTIPWLLSEARSFSSTDPLDKVYALLGMPAFANLPSPMRVDYTKSTEQLYTKVTAMCIELGSLGPLEIIHHHGEITEDFPSWVPSWNHKPIRIAPPDSVWKPSGDVPIRAEIYGPVLKIDGLVLDIVELEQKTDPQRWFNVEGTGPDDRHPLLDLWRIQNAKKTPDLYVTGAGERVVDVYATTLLMGIGRHAKRASEDPAQSLADISAFIAHLLEVRGEDAGQLAKAAKHGNWRYFETIAPDLCWNRSTFTTRNGYMGLGPSVLEPGDLVCILFGGNIPFILRPKDGYFQFVGDAYVHGVMDGEAVQMWKDRKLEKQTFEIR